jgi:hypothetical protein
MFCSVNPAAVLQLLQNPDDFMSVLNSLDWAGDRELTRSLQESVLNSTVMGQCDKENVKMTVDNQNNVHNNYHGLYPLEKEQVFSQIHHTSPCICNCPFPL